MSKKFTLDDTRWNKRTSLNKAPSNTVHRDSKAPSIGVCRNGKTAKFRARNGNGKTSKFQTGNGSSNARSTWIWRKSLWRKFIVPRFGQFSDKWQILSNQFSTYKCAGTFKGKPIMYSEMHQCKNVSAICRTQNPYKFWFKLEIWKMNKRFCLINLHKH